MRSSTSARHNNAIARGLAILCICNTARRRNAYARFRTSVAFSRADRRDNPSAPSRPSMATLEGLCRNTNAITCTGVSCHAVAKTRRVAFSIKNNRAQLMESLRAMSADKVEELQKIACGCM